MTFDPTVWVDDSEPDITAGELNRIETGIADAHDALGDSAASAAAAAASAASAAAAVSAHASLTTNPHATTAKQTGGRHHINAAKRGALGDDATNNAVLLQSLLDEIRNQGGGELYIPGDVNRIYRTNGLWVPSNCRIVSDGATLKMMANGVRRGTSGDGDPILATGCLTIRRTSDLGGADISNVLIEGLSINSVSGGPGIELAGSKVTVRDCAITGTPLDCITVDQRDTVTPEQVYIQRCRLENGRRNNVSVIAARWLWIEDCLIRNCSATSPEFDPGCGIEVEPNWYTDPVEYLTFARNVILGNAGSGIGLVLAGWDGQHATNADGILIDGNIIRGNALLTGGAATLGSGIEVRDGVAGQAIRIVNNSIRSQASGYGVHFNSYSGIAVVTGNDLRSNPGGALSGTPGGSYTTGNL